MAKDIYGEKVSLIDGFRELLVAVREKGVSVALASSSRRSWIDIVLDRFELRPYFDAVVSVEDLEPIRGKPAPDIYLRTAELLGVASSECVVIERFEKRGAFRQEGPGCTASVSATASTRSKTFRKPMSWLTATRKSMPRRFSASP